ncbi:MAG: hypothetical protein ACJ73D_01185 [Pyrinomonadaceae bacterium]
MKAIYSIAALFTLGLLLTGCGMMGGTNVTVNANTAANSNGSANSNSAANSGPTSATGNAANANANANANAAKTDSGPKRISFTKGADWSSENLTLAAGQSKQFVVSASPEQYLNVESSSSDVKLLMVTKKNVGVEKEGASLGAVLSGKGDYVFEVRNPGKKEVKTSIRVQITDEGGD